MLAWDESWSELQQVSAHGWSWCIIPSGLLIHSSNRRVDHRGHAWIMFKFCPHYNQLFFLSFSFHKNKIQGWFLDYQTERWLHTHWCTATFDALMLIHLSWSNSKFSLQTDFMNRAVDSLRFSGELSELLIGSEASVIEELKHAETPVWTVEASHFRSEWLLSMLTSVWAIHGVSQSSSWTSWLFTWFLNASSPDPWWS